MPLPGIYASQISGHLTPVPPYLAYDSIATVTGNGSATSLSFTSIPSTYKHLQIRILARSTTTGTGSGWIDAVFNSDSSSNYSFHYLAGDGTSAVAGGGINRSTARIGLLWSSSNLANTFEATVCDILDYQNTNKYKTTRSLIGGNTNTGYSEIYLASNSWRSTSAISQIDLTAGGWTFATGTSIALYGIKG
jgi:hypothetical protein